MKTNSNAIWMFTGQGSLVPGAAKALYEADIIFKNALDKYTAFLEEILHIPVLKILITPTESSEDLSKTQYAQPVLVALQLAQIAMWRGRGMKPAIVLGHSIGEFAAASATGIMLAEDALRLSVVRGRLMSECPPGSMLAVFAPTEHLRLPNDIVVAAQNGPSMTVLAGTREHLQQFIATIPKEIGHTYLPVSHAFHSPLMASAADSFRKHVSTINLTEPQDIRFISTMTGSEETTLTGTSEYWVNQIMQPVRFLDAIKTICKNPDHPKIIIEIGPSSTLINMTKRIVGDDHFQWIASADAIKDPAKKSLFKSVALPWDKPKIENIREENNTSCIYETVWISDLPPVTTRTSKPCLLLSQEKIDFELPPNWKSFVINSKDTLAEQLSKDWSTIVLLSSGSEVDVGLGLFLLQQINSKTKEVVFSIGTSSGDDAGLYGVARTCRLERPELRVRCIECEPRKLFKALDYNSEDEISFGDNGVKVSRLQKYNNFKTTPLVCSRDATYIITGGTGALGLVSAQLLIEKGAKYILLLSRSAKPITALEILRRSCEIKHLVCDVSQEESLLEANTWLKNHNWPKVRGIIHTAGTLTDGLIENQSEEKLHLAFSSKIRGAKNLRSVFSPPDFFILFSSASALFGSIGQASYAAANATLDALALKWAKSGENVLSIQWGAWSEAGMAVRHNAVKRAETAGFGSLSTELGKTILENLIAARKHGVVCVSPIDWSKIIVNTSLVSNLRHTSQDSIDKKELRGVNFNCERSYY